MSVGVDSVRMSVMAGGRRARVRVWRVAGEREIGRVVGVGGQVGECEGGHCWSVEDVVGDEEEGEKGAEYVSPESESYNESDIEDIPK